MSLNGNMRGNRKWSIEATDFAIYANKIRFVKVLKLELVNIFC